MSEIDALDEMRGFREEFLLPNGTYFLGNSLGAQPRNAAGAVQAELSRWQTLGVEGHFLGQTAWMNLDQLLKPELSKILGCQEQEVGAMNTLTVNLHLLLSRFYWPEGCRKIILTEPRPFPSDWYALESAIRARGEDPAECLVELRPRDGEVTLRTEDILAQISSYGDRLCMVCMGAVQYYTGQYFDVARITEAAHEVGALALWDCAHAVGAVELRLSDWGVDAAVFCCYKYLNGGPGAVGGIYVNRKYLNHESPAKGQLLGWFGHEEKTRFDMTNEFRPAPGIDSFRLSEIPAFSAVCLLASLRIFSKTTMAALRKRSLMLTSLLISEIRARPLCEQMLEIVTPEREEDRGGHVSLKLRGDEAACRAMHAKIEKRGFVVDYRRPGVLRIAPSPFYNTSEEVKKFAEALNLIFNEK